jgi:site-specific recombinase XerD
VIRRTGAKLELIQKLLGHSSITTTIDVYTHPEATLLKSAFASLTPTILQLGPECRDVRNFSV